MWQRFTERARRVVFFAQEEAGRLGENYVSTEHLLLGLVRENDSVAARILDRMGVSLGRIRGEVERHVARGDGRLGQDMQLTPRAKRVIDLAYDEARQLNNNYIGTEHLLLGLIREGEGLAGRILFNLGVNLERTRREVMQLQDAEPARNKRRVPARTPGLVRLLCPWARGVCCATTAVATMPRLPRPRRRARSWKLPQTRTRFGNCGPRPRPKIGTATRTCIGRARFSWFRRTRPRSAWKPPAAAARQARQMRTPKQAAAATFGFWARASTRAGPAGSFTAPSTLPRLRRKTNRSSAPTLTRRRAAGPPRARGEREGSLMQEVTPPPSPPTRARRLALAACMFLITATFGFLQPFVPLYLEAAGLTRSQIGIVTGVGSGTALLIQPLLGRLSDRLDARRPLMVALALVAGLAYEAFRFAPFGTGAPFSAAVVVFTLLTALGVNGFTYLNVVGGVLVGRMVGTGAASASSGAGAYARYRVWGSVGYILVALVTGWLVSRGAGPRSGLPRSELDAVFAWGPLLFFAIASWLFSCRTGSGQPLPSPPSPLPGLGEGCLTRKAPGFRAKQRRSW
jgi:hypothetical protein